MTEPNMPLLEGGVSPKNTPHGSDYKEQLKDDIFTICSGCHLDHPGHTLDAGAAINGMSHVANLPSDSPLTRKGQLVCTSCHLPHGAPFPTLFEEKHIDICARCHG